jgi:LAO/AO transport system kinase
MDPRAELIGGSRRALEQAITLAESTRPDHRLAAEALLASVPAPANTLRIGLSGVPGVGKSTFIEAFGLALIAEGHRVAVLAVDPSSPVTGGAILGDKTRMPRLSTHDSAFVRPSAAGQTLGGVARRTADVIRLVEAAGFDIVLVETVGVGQSETAVHGLVDVFCLLLPPAGGDELQGIKKGIVELADLLVVTKADGDMVAAAGRAVADYRSALHLIAPSGLGWQPTVLAASALTGAAITDVWQTLQAFRAQALASGRFAERRAGQAEARLWQEITAHVLESVREAPGLGSALDHLSAAVRAGKLHPAAAAREIVQALRQGS